MGLHDFTLYSIICRNARHFGEAVAWFEAHQGASFSFDTIRDRVERLAGGLQHLRLKPGERIGVLGRNSFEYFLLYGAAAAVGAVMLPVNWRLSPEEIRYNLKDGEAALLFVDPEFQDALDSVRSDLPQVRQVIPLAGEQGPCREFTALMESGTFTAPEPAVDHGAVIIHTAAVAGYPRGALLSHANLITSSHQFMQSMALGPADVHLNLLPLFHVGGLFMAMSCFHAGSRTVNMRSFDAGKAADLIAGHRASVLFDFAPILGSILQAGRENDIDLSSLTKVIGLDSPETVEQYQQHTGGTFYSFFGQTETSCLATLSPYNERPGSAGRTIPAAEVALLDEEDRPVPQGESGEIAVRGPMVFMGYINLAEDTAHTFRNGWHHTGDLGRFDQDGYLFYMGRKAEKELIKPGGENVYPAEVERVILQHPAIRRTVVFGVPDPKWKEGIKAVCEVRPYHDITAQELIDFVGERIARFKKPQYVELVGQLPLLADGRPDREQVKQQYGSSAA